MSREKIWGLHALQSALQRGHIEILHVYLLEGRQDKRMQQVVDELRRKNISHSQVTRQELDAMSKGERHQGVVAETVTHHQFHENDLKRIIEKSEQPFVLILDGVTDPHNLGAILRSADAAGVDCVIAPKDKAAGLNSTVRKVACGAAEVVPFIQVTNLARTMKWLQEEGVWLYGTAGEASENIFTSKLSGAIGIVMGAEGTGLRRLTREHCDFLIHIPMAGSVSSLNVSVATGVCLFEVVRQRG